MVPARIAAISQETPTVKRFTLTPRGPLAFLPGQWVDFAVPGIAAVGGYSFTSTPRQLERCGTFDLAIRRSAHPVATWLHDKARAGDEVAVRIGGSFTYQPGDERRPLLLLAGGVGINPLLSILQHCCELAGHGGDSSSGGSGGSGSIAGPFGGPAMEDDMIGKLGVLGVAQQQVRFERWW
ncbi:oxidoreductase NAD-binding domain-containing 1 [Chlorella sorokiniana]|uniref:Oxidoreductase NAD-binding domain-containing 1 n=1 Tax=Chlorella sorokiniana TaxID=3076 RepID=A0A2P6TYR2_CHLSO|nr:oxidoreductase NAD-binding domain-containing 1 [Chlorella sorokiniana]|eukprot:PRW59202.1 oxidoreductase NAD-binding domain-containing 1 [Chlorella sorokiniana]